MRASTRWKRSAAASPYPSRPDQKGKIAASPATWGAVRQIVAEVVAAPEMLQHELW
jgi:hypothetical protein